MGNLPFGLVFGPLLHGRHRLARAISGDPTGMPQRAESRSTEFSMRRKSLS